MVRVVSGADAALLSEALRAVRASVTPDMINLTRILVASEQHKLSPPDIRPQPVVFR